MSVRTAPNVGSGRLAEPVTEAGCVLLDLLNPQLPRIEAGVDENDRSATFPVKVFEILAEDGVLGATVPRELGGLGLGSLHDVALALLRVAEVDASTALALHMQLSRGLTLSYEWRHGSPAARSLAERLLRGMGAGEAVVSTTTKDPGTRVVTTLSPDGPGRWLLSGRKTLVSMAPIATHFVVLAQTTEDRPRVGAVVVPRDTPGLRVLDNWDGLGMRASGSDDIVMDGCSIPEEDIFLRGYVGERADAALAGQTVSSITMLGIYTGVAQAARDFVLGALGRRSSPPGAATRTLVAEIEANLFTLRSTVVAALEIADELSADAAIDPAERGLRMMTSFQCAKLLANRVAPALVNDCLTLIGGASYVGTHPLARLYRDVRAGGFMQPFTYPDGVDYLSAQALGRDHGA